MEVGMVETSIHERDWQTVTELPERAAKEWLFNAAPEAYKAMSRACCDTFRDLPWGNRYGVVVCITQTSAFALYRRDIKYYLMTKNIS
jgi:hypothetical protein